MGGRKGRLAGALVVAVVAGWSGVATAGEILHLIHTSDVRGTVGICG